MHRLRLRLECLYLLGSSLLVACAGDPGGDAGGDAGASASSSSSDASTSGEVTSTTTTASTTTTSTITTSSGATTTTSTSTTSATTAADTSTTDAGTSTTAADTTTSDATTGEGGCDYALVHESPGDLLTMTYNGSYFAVHPLMPGASFTCMRVEFDMQTVDSLETTLKDLPGCPIFTAIAGVRGDTPPGKLLAGALFKKYKVGCTPGPDRIELDTFADALVSEGPWPLGERYHFEIVIEPFVSRVRVLQDGVQVGPTIEASIEGANLELARDPIIELGLKKPVGDAYFPDYGGSYSDLQVWADVAP